MKFELKNRKFKSKKSKLKKTNLYLNEINRGLMEF
jgi:hypothetical protein